MARTGVTEAEAEAEAEKEAGEETWDGTNEQVPMNCVAQLGVRDGTRGKTQVAEPVPQDSL